MWAILQQNFYPTAFLLSALLSTSRCPRGLYWLYSTAERTACKRTTSHQKWACGQSSSLHSRTLPFCSLSYYRAIAPTLWSHWTITHLNWNQLPNWWEFSPCSSGTVLLPEKISFLQSWATKGAHLLWKHIKKQTLIINRNQSKMKSSV